MRLLFIASIASVLDAVHALSTIPGLPRPFSPYPWGRHRATCIRSAHHSTYIQHRNGFVIEMSEHCEDSWQFQHMENGTANISSDYYAIEDRRTVYLNANRNGSVGLADNRQYGNYWTPRRNQDGSWSFRSQDDAWLNVDINGSLCTSADEGSFWIEYFGEILPVFYGYICIKSIHGTYLRNNDDAAADMSIICDPRAYWEITYEEDNKIGIISKPKWLHAYRDGSIELHKLSYSWRDFGRHLWRMRKNDDGSWSFSSVNGAWLSADKNGSVSTIKDEQSATTHFLLLLTPSDSITETTTSASSEVGHTTTVTSQSATLTSDDSITEGDTQPCIFCHVKNFKVYVVLTSYLICNLFIVASVVAVVRCCRKNIKHRSSNNRELVRSLVEADP